MTVTPRLIGYKPHPYLMGKAQGPYVGQAEVAIAQLAASPEGQEILGDAWDSVGPIVTGIVDEARAQAADIIKDIKCKLTPCKCAIQTWNTQWGQLASVFETEYKAAQDPISRWGIALAFKAELESPYWSSRFGGKTKAPDGFGGTTKPCGWDNPPSVVWGPRIDSWIAGNEAAAIQAQAAGEKPEHKQVTGGLPPWAPWAIGGAAALALFAALSLKGKRNG